MSGKIKTNFLLDTNIVLGFLNSHKTITDSQITQVELLSYPKITQQEEFTINQFLSFVEILPLNELIVVDKVITIRRSKRLKLPDAIIAATAIIHNLTLVTGDTALADSTSELVSINPLSNSTITSS